MPAKVLITVDTELSAGNQLRGMSARANFESSVLGRCAAGDFGICWQMERLEAMGLCATYFVDPMPALVHGGQIIADIVGPILERGHEVQMHIHTEWLQWAKTSPVDGRLGRNIADFSYNDQLTLLTIARDLLEAAGAPRPIAFRAGNYGANEDSLKALAALGIAWDASVNPAYLGDTCQILADPAQGGGAMRHAVALLPVAGLNDVPGHFRPAQICAISAAEMRAALHHAAATCHPAFVIVTHSFEMLTRDRARPNRAVTARFEEMCRNISRHTGLISTGFSALDPVALCAHPTNPARLGPNYLRTARRAAEQALATWRYERRLLPV
ncbi:MAG: hypothetical protein WC803_11345 [Sphingomonas sp.]|jgi:hypothetical protein